MGSSQVDASGRKNESVWIEVEVIWRPIRESVSYGVERVHFYIGDFGY